MTSENLRRNLDLWVDRKLYKDKYTTLSNRYCISRDRCRQIYLRMERRYKAFINYKYIPDTFIENTYFMQVKARYADNEHTT